MRFTTLTHVDTHTDAAGASLLSFRPRRPLAFKAGQFGLWTVGAAARPFTIASSPQDELVQLGTRLHSGSGIKRALSALRPGDTVRLLGGLGTITPPKDGTPVTYLAQGIGITPARALLRDRLARPQTLIHVGPPYFRDELQSLVDEAEYPTSREDFAAALTNAVRKDGGSHYVVAGSTAFVRSTSNALRQQGVPTSLIHTDGFIGLSDSGSLEQGVTTEAR